MVNFDTSSMHIKDRARGKTRLEGIDDIGIHFIHSSSFHIALFSIQASGDIKNTRLGHCTSRILDILSIKISFILHPNFQNNVLFARLV